MRTVQKFESGPGSRWIWLLGLVSFVACRAMAAGVTCKVCGKEIPTEVYTWTDKVTRVKQMLCPACVELPDSCYLCSIPVRQEGRRLADGRVLCQRDAGTVVLDEREVLQICEQVKADLDRQFIRFITFPETNVTVKVVDRVAIQDLFKFAGNDFSCPNVWGYFQPRTNQGQLHFEISLLSGLPRETLVATCVHEYTHAWVAANVPAARREKLARDAQEGFCELVSYLFVRDRGYEAAQRDILSSHYTRGQIKLFFEAERQFGFNDVVDWMLYGSRPLLSASDPSLIRQLELPKKPGKTSAPDLPPIEPESPPVPATNRVIALPERLILKSVTGTSGRRWAIINDQTFGVGDEWRVRLDRTNLHVRCLEIRANSVLIQIRETGERQELWLAEN